MIIIQGLISAVALSFEPCFYCLIYLYKEEELNFELISLIVKNFLFRFCINYIFFLFSLKFNP